jgi:hypothetical protein
MDTVRGVFTRLHCGLILAGLLSAATPAAADAVTDWNALIVQFTNAAGRTPPAFMLDTAMAHIAIHDAVQAYQHRYKTYNAPIANATGSMAAAVATAAHDVLVSRFLIPAPNAALIAQVDTAYNTYMAANGLAPGDPGVLVGQQAAMNIIVRRTNDGAFPANPEVFTGSTGAGEWRSTPPAFAPMAAPWMGAVTQFVPRNNGELQNEPGPPALTSGQYTRDYDEVKLMGRRTDSGRTPEQTTFALFYSGNFLTILNNAVRAAALNQLTDIGDRARLFALAHVAGADSGIVVWENKRTYHFWRPSTAILNAADDGNPRTEPDPGWLPLINDPPYPDYTSGANGLTGAMMRAVENVVGDDEVPSFNLATTALQGGLPIAPRPYTRFSAIADDVVEARILLGIHFRFADVVARRQGKQAADRVFAHAFQPLD